MGRYAILQLEIWELRKIWERSLTQENRRREKAKGEDPS